MVRSYVMVRMPKDVHDKYMNIKIRIEQDLTRMSGHPIILSKPQLFQTIVDYNENFIEVDLGKLSNAFNGGRRRRNNVF